MARIRHTLTTGDLVPKTAVIPQVRAPRDVIDGIARRRESPAAVLPVAPRLGHHAWRDTRRTIAHHLG